MITVSSPEEADKISHLLVTQRKASCVNTIPHVTSLFRWQNKIDSAAETMLIAKTSGILLPELIEMVKQNHSYAVPEIIALPIVGGNPDYLRWIDAELKATDQ